MATIVAFHAHPDDESIAMGGTIARAVAEGHRVVVVVATDGAVGEVAEGYLEPGESLAERRAAELRQATSILGAQCTIQLPYRDSGMVGVKENEHPDAFWNADPAEAAERLAAILREEAADVLTVYDEHGGYGHPDHIQVHRVGHAAAQIAGVGRVYEATMNRDSIRRLMKLRRGVSAEEQEMADRVGLPEEEITTAVDVSDWIREKRAAMVAHGSQMSEDGWFMSLPPDVFAATFGTEWFRRTKPQFVCDPSTPRELWLIPEKTTRI